MGINFDKIEPYQMGDNFPLRQVDPSKADICYLRVHNQGDVAEKQKHHSLYIDVGGETCHNNTRSTQEIYGRSNAVGSE
jgi:4-hydroxy-3-methylbut-2-enyl diphosphate reductase IspH